MSDDMAPGWELADSDNSRFRLLADSIEDYAIFMLDLQGRVCSWNKGAVQITGYTKAEVLGQHFSILYTQDVVLDKVPAAELALAASNGRFGHEGWRRRKDGSTFWVSVVITTLDGHVIPPMAFIPAAERYGLMPEIDRWVIRTAFAHIATLPHGANSLYSINLSGESMNDEKALSYIIEQLASSGVQSKSICFEITETAAIANLLNARAFILALKEKGCKFALDDFGSGMSSFGYLKHLPVNFLKIDGCFVKDMETDTVDVAMVTAINSIGHVMGLETIAEFVENEGILTILRTLGVDFAQGYGVGHPLAMKPASA